ncbi:MAG: flagellar motor switch protein FliN [Spirochaetes bacterium]|nr:flagellar motor switch protein FliN [Spirochaetota bacterium]
MSDGALSQDEIDSLLAGLDTGGGAPAAPKSSGLSPGEMKHFKGILEETVASQSQNISVFTGAEVTLQPPELDQVTRDGFLQSMPEEVLAIKIDITGGIPGDHLYVMSKAAALHLASLGINNPALTELDDMSISAVSECFSTLTGTEISTITDKTGNRTIQSSTADGSFVPKAMVRVPSGDFVRATYKLTVDNATENVHELFSMQFVRDIVAASGGKTDSQPGTSMQAMGQAGQAIPGMQMPGMQMPGMQNQGSGQAMPGMQMPGMQSGYPQQMQYSQNMGGMYQQPGMQGIPGMTGMAPPNVQPVQFASLSQRAMGQESGNIGLIMDVFMELTVELGRTKKLIREILGMGEGTIIELDKLAGEPVDILVNHKLIAKGEVVVIDENFGVRVTEIVPPMERMSDLA